MNKTELPTDDSSNRLDSHCHPPERRGNSTTTEGNYDQQLDNKWYFRWGPTGKGSENWRDKCADLGKQKDAGAGAGPGGSIRLGLQERSHNSFAGI